MKRGVVVVVVVVAVAMVACGSKDAGKSDKPGSAAADKATPEPTAGTTGIPDCDDYIAKMTACIPKMDADTGEQMKAELEVLTREWKADAAKAKSGGPRIDNCKSILEAARSMYAKLGCTF